MAERRTHAASGARLARAIAVPMLLLAAGTSTATVLELQVTDPRSYAWFIGDVLTREVEVVIADGFSLDEAALPAPGAINHWLELADVSVRRQGQRTTIALGYRITNTVDDGVQTTRVLPGFELITVTADRRVPTLVSEWSFTQTAVLPASDAEFLTASDVRPDRPPAPAPWAAHFVRVSMLALAVLVLGLYLFYCHFGAVWLARWRRPFTAALRDLRREPPQWDVERELRGLERFHAAVNEAAGRVVMVDDLERFFTGNPLYTVEREAIHELFARSREVFFEEGGTAEVKVSRDQLVTLCQRLSVLELSTP